MLESFRLHWVSPWLTPLFVSTFLSLRCTSHLIKFYLHWHCKSSYFFFFFLMSLAVLEAGIRHKKILSSHHCPSGTVYLIALYNCHPIHSMPFLTYPYQLLSCNFILSIQKFLTWKKMCMERQGKGNSVDVLIMGCMHANECYSSSKMF